MAFNFMLLKISSCLLSFNYVLEIHINENNKSINKPTKICGKEPILENEFGKVQNKRVTKERQTQLGSTEHSIFVTTDDGDCSGQN